MSRATAGDWRNPDSRWGELCSRYRCRDRIFVKVRGARIESMHLDSSVSASMDVATLAGALTGLVNEAPEEAECAVLGHLDEFDQPALYRVEELQGELDVLRRELA